jgi:4,5-dihydroxyphthalate decarboxylase
MSRLPLTLAARDYDYLSPLAMGDVEIEGVDLTLIRAFDALPRVVKEPEIDGGETSFSRYVQGMVRGDRSFIGLPVFLMRAFRHRCFFVRRDSDLADVTDLAGKRVGTNEWPASGNTWTRAVLRERGVPIERVRWLVGQVSPGYKPVPPDALPAGVQPAPAGSTLVDLLLEGQIDALMCPWPPEGFYDQGSRIRRLYEDYRTAEREYYRRTRVHPAHHVTVLKRELVERNPWVVRAVFNGLDQSRRRSEQNRWELSETTPWLLAELEETAALMGKEFQPDGLSDENRHMIAAFCEEQYAQRLIPEPIDPKSVFAEYEKLMDG